MIFACGLSSYDVAMFHLYNHAFFKALLFLTAGAVIHAISDEQDLRKIGGLRIKLPLSYAVMLIGSLALMGFPFLSGFYSKDMILELAYSKYTIFGHFAYYLGLLSVFSTSFYSCRLLYLVFLSEPNGFRENILNAAEPNIKMLLPLCILVIFSIFSGFLSKDLFVGFGSSFWGNSIFILPTKHLSVDVEFITIFSKLEPLFLSFIGAFFAFFLYCVFIKDFYFIKQNKYFKIVYSFLNRRWYVDRIYNQYIVQKTLDLGFLFFYKNIDRGIMEHFGPLGIIQTLIYFFNKIKIVQNGTIFHYLIIYFSCIILFVFFIQFLSIFYIFIEIFFLFLTVALFIK
jgi:NADH-ubiquinone oxidoreductase chain 5